MPSATKTFTARCHCTKTQLTFDVPQSSLPLTAHTCHCSICRHTHGTLSLFHAHIPSAPSPDPRQLSTVTSYRTSPASDVVRFFCSTCGSQLISLGESDGDWYVSTSLVEGGDESVFEYKEAIFATHAVDGGLADWLGQDTRKWDTFVGVGDPLTDEEWAKSKKSITEKPRDQEALLNVHCHCKGVEFNICRPAYASEAFLSQFPQMEIPPENPALRNRAKEIEDGTWWFAHDRSKYLGGACLCTSCRLSTGCELMDWSFVPTTFITLADGSPFKTEFGTLKAFESSPDTVRRFCGTCGATVFWQHMIERPHVIDVAIGLIDAETGARAEDWIEWRESRPSYEEDAVNKKLATELADGYAKWAAEHTGIIKRLKREG